MRVAVFLCVIAIAGVFTSGYKIEYDEGVIEELQEDVGAMGMKKMEADADEDRTDHDCNTIKAYTKENLEKEPWWRTGRKFVGKKTYKKYNHAYGLMIVGGKTFANESMRRACYLMRYIFADNQHMRSLAYKNDFFTVGYNGGWCCPPQMGNQGQSCSCAANVINGDGESKTNHFPFLGKGAAAHEMAHSFIKHILAPLVTANKMKLPQFINNTNWNYTKVYNENIGKCAKATKASEAYGALWDWLWNSQKQDLLAKPRATKITMCKAHHYFIYTGQQQWLFKNKVSRPATREAFIKRNPNLSNLMNMVWPCNNDYLSVCEDGSYGFTKGLAQEFLIGKTDPKDTHKMICTPNIDKAEIKKSDVKKMEKPTADLSDHGKCIKVVKDIDEKLYHDLKHGKSIKVDAFKTYLKTGTEYAWYMRRCCSKTANFKSAVKKY